MVIPQIVLLVVWQVIPVISSTLISYRILPSDVKQEYKRAKNAKPNKTKTQSEAKRVCRCLCCDEHIAVKSLVMFSRKIRGLKKPSDNSTDVAYANLHG